MSDLIKLVFHWLLPCALLTFPMLIAQEVPSEVSPTPVEAAKPTLDELMTRFADIESSYLPFHIDYSESMTHKKGPFLPSVTDDESNNSEYQTQRGHQAFKVWMLETTINDQGVFRTTRSVNNESGYHLNETSPAPGRFFEDDGVTESAEPQVRPLEGVFPLMFHTDAPILLSQHYAAEPKGFTLDWHDKLARVWCRHSSGNGHQIQVELLLDPDFGWHPVFMKRFLIQGERFSVGERFPDEWKVTEFRKLDELVRVSVGEFSGPIRRTAMKEDESKEVFFRSRFKILKSTYQTRVPELVFSAETPIGGSPIGDLEPVGGELIPVEVSVPREEVDAGLSTEEIPAVTTDTFKSRIHDLEAQIAALKEFNTLVNQYNSLMQSQLYSEAKIVAGKARDLNTDAPQAMIMVEKAKLMRQLALNNNTRSNNLDDTVKTRPVIASQGEQNGPRSEEILIGGSKLIVVETSPVGSSTEIIRQIVKALEDANGDDDKTKYSALSGRGIQLKIGVTMEESGRPPLTNLIVGLGKLNVPDLKVSLDRDDLGNNGILSISEEASAEAVARVSNYLANQKHMPLPITIPTKKPPGDTAMVKPVAETEGDANSDQVKIFSLKNSNAKDAGRIIEGLFGFPPSLATDERTNSLIVRGDQSTLSEIEATLLKLDSSEPAASPSNPLSAHNGGNSTVAPTPIAEYRQRLDALEQPVQQLAEQVRAAEAQLGKDHADSIKLRAELRTLVQQTFAARQEIQRAELAEFTRRLQRMQQAIETREKISGKIVDRRVVELLNPDTQWAPESGNNDGRIIATRSDGTETSYIPWKAPKNAKNLEISPTAWGEPVNGLRVALAVTDGPETKTGTQRLHLVINNVSNELIRLDNTGWADDFTMAMHVRRNSGEQVETRRPKQDRFFAPSTSAHSLEPGETAVLATKLIGLGLADEPNSEDSADLWILDQRPKINPDGHRIWYIVGSRITVPGIPGHETEFPLHTESTALEFGNRRAEQNSATDKNTSSSAPKSDVKETNGIVFESAAATDETSPPESAAEKAIARMVLVFFQDQARRAVPALMIDHGSETLVLTTGPATIVPEGVGHAIDRAFLEFPGEADVASEYIDIKTADIRFHRAKPGLTQFQLNEPVDLAIGDSLSAIIQSGQPNLRVTPRAARISALDQATSFSLATHKFRHEFSGLVQIDTRLPEGTPLFKNGELAGITLLGTRFMKDDVPGSYVVPASRIVEVLQQLKTE